MKNAKWAWNMGMFAIAAIALLTIVAIAYAQANSLGLNSPKIGGRDMMDMMGGSGMDEMHKQMTKNLDPETRDQMDKMHEMCKKSSGKGNMMQ